MKKLFSGALALCLSMLFAAPAALAANPPDTAMQIQVAGADTALPGNLYDAISSFREPADKCYDKLGFSANHYAYTQEELTLLAGIIHNEVRGESYTAMLAVGNVVMNRVLSPGYPGDTVRDVVTRPNQFAYRPYTKPLAICVRAARDVLENEVWVVPQDVYFFRAVESRADWGRHDYWKHIGATAFYRDTYAGRCTNGIIPPALHKRAYEWPQYGCEPGLRVARIQQMLCGLGYAVDTDGKFDEGTRAALIRFQKNEALTADGVANPATLGALIRKTTAVATFWIDAG